MKTILLFCLPVAGQTTTVLITENAEDGFTRTGHLRRTASILCPSGTIAKSGD